jgi:O-antigen ligase
MQNRINIQLVQVWQTALTISFPLQFLSLRFYFYDLIIATIAFLATKPWSNTIPKKKILFLIPFLLFLLINVLGMLYSTNKVQAIKELETYSAFLVIPLLWLWLPESSPLFFKRIALVIILTALAHCILAHAICINEIIKSGESLNLLFSAEKYQYLYLSYRVGIHPTYLGVLIITALISLWYYSKNKTTIALTAIGLAGVYLTLFLFLLLSRGPIIGLFVLLVFNALWRLKSTGFLVKLSVYGAIILIAASILFFAPLRMRFIDPVVRMIQTKSYHFDNDSLSLHIRSWVCAVSVNQSLATVIFGQGTGEERTVLNNCYAENEYTAMVNSGLNAHNEFLSQYVRLGLIGMFSFLSIIVVYFLKGFQNNNLMVTSFVILISIICLFESILNVSKGVFFISYLFPYFYLLDKEKAITST